MKSLASQDERRIQTAPVFNRAQSKIECLVESRRTVGQEEAATLDDTVRKREAEVRGEKLLDVGTADVCRLLDLGNAEDLADGDCISQAQTIKRNVRQVPELI